MTETATMTPQQIEEAIRLNGRFWGSNRDYIEDEVRRAKERPDLIRTRTGPNGGTLAWIGRASDD